MANSERGTYRPSADDVRVFDGAEDDEDVEGSRLPLLIVIALFVLAAFAGVVWLAYNQGLQRGHLDVPRTIAAAPGPAKVAPPEDTAGNTTPFKGLKVYEQPAPSDEEADQDNTASVQPTAQAVKPATTTAAPIAQTTAPVTTHVAATTTVVPPQVTVAAAPKVKPHVAPETTTAAASSVATAPPASLTQHAATTTAASSGAFVLQIGAYKSQADAEGAWQAYKAKHATLLAGYNSDVKQVDLGDKGVWYRLRVGSFPDKDVAGAFCDRLKADGGACFPAK
jgi:cell division protein FtsN